MTQNTLFSEERSEEILKLIREFGKVSVNTLSERFNVSSATIRMDLTKLSKNGEILRTHGGAMLAPSINSERLISERENKDKKQLIAKEAMSLIENNDTLLLDTGTTMYFFAEEIANSKLQGLSVFTNDFEIARILEKKGDVNIHLLGGNVRSGFHYCYGQNVMLELLKYNFDKLFIATSSINIEKGLTTQHSETAILKSVMIRSANTKILLTDSSKFDQVSFAQFACLNEIDILITDNDLSTERVKKLNKYIKKIIKT